MTAISAPASAPALVPGRSHPRQSPSVRTSPNSPRKARERYHRERPSREAVRGTRVFNGYIPALQSARVPQERKGTLRVIPLGGLGEIGKNMMIYEYEDDIILIDAGIMFPTSAMLGIDYIIPDISYLLDKKEKIRGFVFTHGHEDHIGSVPFIIPRLPVPMYATKLTKSLIEAKCAEHEIKPDVRLVNPQDVLTLGVFTIRFIPFAHTIPDEVGLVIDTPVGRFLHITDFRFDPAVGTADLMAKLGGLGKEGVRCLLLESTNAEVKGASISEKVVAESISTIFRRARGRIITTSFASNLDRVQGVVDAAARNRRKLFISGRSLDKMINITMKLGYLRVPEGLFADIRRIANYKDEEVAILCTGSQGEEFSALARMANGEHRQIKIKKGDTVVMSSSAIPGNEEAINTTIDNLFRQGGEVLYGGESAGIHSSGHAKREDLMLVTAAVRPDYFIPIHGQYRHLVHHARLAQQVGIPEENTFVGEDGTVFEFTKEKGRISEEKVPSSYVLVDGLGIGDVGNIVLRDRQAMAKEGVFVVIMTIDHRNGTLVTSPDIISRGFVYMRAAEDLIQETRNKVKALVQKHKPTGASQANWALLKSDIRDELGEFLFIKTQRRPMIIPVVIEI